MIDHFTDFLLVSLNQESLLPLMQSHGLLTDHDLELINSGPTGYHKNQLILGYVKQMDDPSLEVFIKLLQESHPHISIPLDDGKSINCYTRIHCIYIGDHRRLHILTKKTDEKPTMQYFHSSLAVLVT